MKYLVVTLYFFSSLFLFASDGHSAKKSTPDEILNKLKEANERFVNGELTHPNLDKERMILSGKKNQGDYAYATIISCSDSRVPVEAIFDAGIMDLFVVRVAGNVCDVDEAGTIEYGLAHVYTPVLVVLGHTQCGAVTAVTNAVEGNGVKLERNIPALVDNIVPAVNRAKGAHPDKHGAEIILYAIEENVWQSIHDLFMESPITRKFVNNGKVKVVGAIYDVSTGKIDWLSESKVDAILEDVESNPNKAINEFAD